MYLKSDFEFDQTESLEVVTLPNNWSLSDLSLADYELDQGDLYIKLDGKVFKIANYDDNLTKLIKTSDGESISSDFISEFIVNKEIELVAVYSFNQSIGKVIEVEGQAYAIRSGQKYQLKVGMDLFKGQNIETLKNSSIKIKMSDQSVIKLAEFGKLSLSDFTYDEGSSVGKSIFSIFKGIMAFTSGLIARDDPSNVLIKTPIAEIGLRGTTVAFRVDSEGKSSVTLVEGRITVSNNEGTTILNTPLQTAYIPSINSFEIQQEKVADFLSKYEVVISRVELNSYLDFDTSSNFTPQQTRQEPSSSQDTSNQRGGEEAAEEEGYIERPFEVIKTESEVLANEKLLAIVAQISEAIKATEAKAEIKDYDEDAVLDDNVEEPVIPIDQPETPIVQPEPPITQPTVVQPEPPQPPLLTEDAVMSNMKPIDYEVNGKNLKVKFLVESKNSNDKYDVWIKFNFSFNYDNKWLVAGFEIDGKDVLADRGNYLDVLKEYFTKLDTSSLEYFLDHLHVLNSYSDYDNLGSDYSITPDSNGSFTYGSVDDAKVVGENGQEKDYFYLGNTNFKTTVTGDVAEIIMSYNDYVQLPGGFKIHGLYVHYDATKITGDQYTPPNPASVTGSKLDIHYFKPPVGDLSRLEFSFHFDANVIGDNTVTLDLTNFLKDQDLTGINLISFKINVIGDLASLHSKLDIKISGAEQNIIDNWNDKINFTEDGGITEGILPGGNDYTLAKNELANNVLTGNPDFQFINMFI